MDPNEQRTVKQGGLLRKKGEDFRMTQAAAFSEHSVLGMVTDLKHFRDGTPLFSSVSHLIPIGTCLQNAQLTKVLLRRHQMLPPLLERVITSHGPPKPERPQVRGARLQNCVGC